jgi:predicted dehydrogenase
MMRRRVRVGVIGVGRMGEYHTRIYAELANVELVGVVDIDKQRARRIAKLYNTKSYDDYKDLLSKVDGVSVAVPTTLHYELTKELLKNHIHVLVEKPMTANLQQAKELIKLADQNGCILQVGHIERFNAAVQELRNIVKNPILIECRRLNPYTNKKFDIGVILDLLIHDLDIVLSLVPKKIKNISVASRKVYGDTEDIAHVILTFEEGCIANLTASRITENKVRTLAITQPDAYIFLDYASQDVHIHRQASSKYMLSKEVLRYKQEAFIERLFIHKDNPLKLELCHFIQCINDKKKNKFNEDDIKSLALALEILQIANNQE